MNLHSWLGAVQICWWMDWVGMCYITQVGGWSSSVRVRICGVLWMCEFPPTHTVPCPQSGWVPVH